MDQLPVQAASYQPEEVRAGVRPYDYIKRALDVCGSLLLLLPALPVFLLLAILIKCESPGPVFFLQPRIGKGGRRFGMYKFRTLRRPATEHDVHGAVMALNGSDGDITRMGAFLRASGLNELPQLLNILKGEMSFVGPRPAVLHHEQYYSAWHKKRLEVTPGVTGLAQVCGRNVIPWGWRVALDRHYVEQRSFTLDLALLLKTAYVVLWHVGTEGREEMYFDFTPPEHDILVELRRKGIWRTFLRCD